MASPVSAFARRKAIQSANGISSIIVSPRPIEEHILPDPRASSPNQTRGPPRKRRRKGNQSATLTSISVPATLSAPVNVPESTRAGSARDFEESGSSDLEGDTENGDSQTEYEVHPTGPARKLSKFSTQRSLVLSDDDSTWTVRLHPHDNIAIVGQYDLWVRSGALSISGAVIHASSKLHRVYAPSTHSIPSIRPVPNPFGSGNPPCEISIISCGSRIRTLKNVAPKFGRIWNSKGEQIKKQRSFVNIQNSADDPYKRSLLLLEPPQDWQTMSSKLVVSDHVAVMVCGPKGAGKSTFCRTLVNALLGNASLKQRNTQNNIEPNSVAFLDLDPGQPEYSPPGELSLYKIQSYNFGPPFTHPMAHGMNELVKAHHFGHLSPKEDPNHYRDCALDLFSHYKKRASKNSWCPLVVNCSGWIQGSGLELLVNFIKRLHLTDVIYMSTAGPDDVVSELATAATTSGTALHQLSSQPSDEATRTAADLRMMQTSSYFHLDDCEIDNLRWNPLPLTRIPPLVVHYAGPKQGILAVLVLGDKQSPDFMETILEGRLVGIVVIENNDALPTAELHQPLEIDGDETDMDMDNPTSEPSETPDHSTPTIHPSIPRTLTGIPYVLPTNHTTPPLSPTTSHSLGQALIRSIDPYTNTLHLLTPIPPSTIHHTLQNPHQSIILMHGNLDTPTWAYAEDFEHEKAMRRRREVVLGEKEEGVDECVRGWVEGQPWAEVGEGRRGSAKVRRVRRDIRYRAQADGPSV